MGVGHLDIGIGQGGAQVFGANPAIQTYANLLQKRQAKIDQDNTYLNNELAKGYDPSVLRNDADRKQYIDKYTAIKQAGIDAENESDPKKKAMAIAGVRQQLSDLATFGEGSKNQGIQERAWATHYQQNPNNWDDSAVEAYRKSKDAVWNGDGAIQDFTTLQRRVDPLKIDEEYKKHKGLITKDLKYDNGTYTPATEPGTGKKGAYMYQRRGIAMDGPDGALANTLHWVTSDPNVQKSIQDRYPNIQGETPQETLALRTKQYMADHGDKEGIYETTKPEFKEQHYQAPIRPSFDDIQYHNKYGTWPIKGESQTQQQNNTPIYRQKWVGDILNGDTDAMKRAEAKVAVDPTYNGKLEFGIGNKGKAKGLISIDVPAKIKYDATGAVVETIPARRVFINPKESNAKEKLNELLNETTGEKVDISQLETPGGKKHVGVDKRQPVPKHKDPLGIFN